MGGQNLTSEQEIPSSLRAERFEPGYVRTVAWDHIGNEVRVVRERRRLARENDVAENGDVRAHVSGPVDGVDKWDRKIKKGLQQCLAVVDQFHPLLWGAE